MDDSEARTRSEAPPGGSDCLRVAVDREQPPIRAQGLKDAGRVTASSEGRVDVQAVARAGRRVRAEAEPHERFLDKHRFVLIQPLDPRSAPMSKRQ
jgi:hypothetical protein